MLGVGGSLSTAVTAKTTLSLSVLVPPVPEFPRSLVVILSDLAPVP